MAGDPLYDPLGTQPPRRRRGRSVLLPACCLAAFALAFVGSRLIGSSKPTRDEGVAIAAIEPAPKIAPTPSANPTIEATPTRADEGREPRRDSNIVVQPNGDTVEYQHGVKIIRLGAARQNQVITVPAGRAAEPDAGGAISFKPTTDAVPVEASAVSFPAAMPVRAPATAGTPRLALMIGGLGLNKGITAEASTRLPPEVGFAFSPYGADLTAEISSVKANGHEAILQLPMEARDTDDGAAPSRSLTANVDAPVLLDRLHWLLARAAGYVGVSNQGGDALLADAAAASPVFKELAAKGLFFVGSGTVPVGRIDAAARAAVLPHGAVDVVCDISGEAAIRASLTRLKDVARLNGQALGYVASPSNPDQIAMLAAALAAQSIRLVPVGTLIASHPGADQAKRN